MKAHIHATDSALAAISRHRRTSSTKTPAVTCAICGHRVFPLTADKTGTMHQLCSIRMLDESHLTAATQQTVYQQRTFSFTLRKAPNVELGLDVQFLSDGNYLSITQIKSDGAIAAWNRQCVGEPREINAGDDIICVNGYTDAKSMLHQCQTLACLKMTVRPSLN